jgi:pimeloyl-ACP methyl ester carboxylesterase
MGEMDMRDFRVLRQFGAAAGLLVCLSLSGAAARGVYDVKASEIPGKPGTIMRVWPLTGGGPSGSEAFRILYRSTSPAGKPIAVSGAIYFPSGAPPVGGRHVLAWAHPTTGVVRSCAPSLIPDNAGLIWGLADMLAQGYVVVATDYPGLGTPGIHPYLIGDSEARSVLDSVRAARNLPKTGATNRFVVWGHSQGGQAALFTGQIAARYAPELKLVGVAAAAPATYLVELFDADKNDATGKELTAMALYSWSKLYHQPIAKVVEPDAMRVYERMARACIESVPEFEALSKAERPLQRERFLKINPTKVEPWRSIMLRNTPGQAPAGAPVFLAQGLADTTVPPHLTKRFGAALCAKGTRVRFVVMPGVTHTFAAKDSVRVALKWMAARCRGAPAPSNCKR